MDVIIDVTGIILMPGNQGKDCPGNGANPAIECCCDECDYMLCCFDTEYPNYTYCLIRKMEYVKCIIARENIT